MPEISREQVAHLARLSRLALDDDELDGLAAQLGVILGAVAQISQVTDAADVPAPSLDADAALAAAPASEGGRFLVPRILDED